MTALCHKYCVDFYNDTSVLREFWLGNIGHSLFDQLYSSFIGLIEYSNDRHLKPFRAINVKRSDAESVPFVHSIINTSIPMGLVNSEDFFRPDRVQHLREVLVPNHARCISSPANDGWNYRMDKGYELDGFRHFRAHLYARFAVPPPPSWAQGVGRASLRAIVVLNKRYSPADLQELLAALGDAAPGINGSVVDWRPLSFRDQLLILSRSHIHLSAPGTGMMYQPFLPDGAVHVNLGSCTPFPYQTRPLAMLSYDTGPVPGYMEQSMVSATPYHRALYYPLGEICAGLRRGRLGELLREAAALVRGGFPIPVPAGANLAADGRIVQALLRRDPAFRAHAQDYVAHPSCAVGDFFWPELVVRELGGWATGECRLNRTLLAELRAQHPAEWWARGR